MTVPAIPHEKLPEGIAFDPASDPVPEDLLEYFESAGARRMVAMAVSPEAERGRWSCRVATEFAQACAERDRAPVLVDLALDRPRLHRLMGLEVAEGISDVILYGASVDKAASPCSSDLGRGAFISAGTPTVGSEEVLGHERWGAVERDLDSCGFDPVFVYLPLRLPGAKRILERVSGVVLLSTPYDTLESQLESLEGKVLSHLMPPVVSRMPSAREERVEAGPTDSAVRSGRRSGVLIALIVMALLFTAWVVAMAMGSVTIPAWVPGPIADWIGGFSG